MQSQKAELPPPWKPEKKRKPPSSHLLCWGLPFRSVPSRTPLSVYTPARLMMKVVQNRDTHACMTYPTKHSNTPLWKWRIQCLTSGAGFLFWCVATASIHHSTAESCQDSFSANSWSRLGLYQDSCNYSALCYHYVTGDTGYLVEANANVIL